jgi:DNA-binding PadR family transcriptional regulator
MSELGKEIARAFVQLHVLHHAEHEDVWGQELIEELGRHGHRLSPGTVYPLLHRLEAQGLLSRRDVLAEGRVRKCYRLTAPGRRALREARAMLRELVEELLAESAG